MLIIASNRPSVRSAFDKDKDKDKDKENPKKTRSGFSTHSNSNSNNTTTPKSKITGHGTGAGSEITIRGSEKEGSWGRKRGKRTPLLIKHLGGVDKRKGEFIRHGDCVGLSSNFPLLQLLNYTS
jgi:hypothetical protein